MPLKIPINLLFLQQISFLGYQFDFSPHYSLLYALCINLFA